MLASFRHGAALVAAVACLSAAPAWADESPASDATPVAAEAAVPVADAPPEPLLKVRASGFLDSRMTGGYASVGHLTPSNDVPRLQNLSEANVQLKLDWGAKGTAFADTSFVWQRGWMYWGAGAGAERVRLADHDVAALHPAAIVAELYGVYNIAERLNLTVGKKRVLWGPGLAWNPTDLLNPPKDPTDPTLQRAGTWLARLEAPFDDWTFTLVGAGKTLQQFGGLPTGLVTYPDNMAAKPDTAAHYMLAARAYRLIAETDINAMLFYSNLFNDAFQDKLRGGLSLSHVFFNALEVHGEAIVQTGSARLYADGACVADVAAAIGCVSQGKLPVGNSKVHDDDLRIKALAGVRYQFGENAAISAEYLFNGDGLNSQQFGDLVHGLALAKSVAAAGMPMPFSLLPAPGDPGTPQKFAFEPLRRHYVFVTYMHPQLNDDFTINTVLIVGLQDLSGQLAPQLTWNAREWLNLTAGLFYTLPGVAGQGAQVAGTGWTEYGLQAPMFRGFLSARAFF